MDLGLDSLSEAEIQRQTLEDKISKQSLGEAPKEAEGKIDRNYEETDLNTKQSYQWIKDLITQENEEYKNLKIELEEITNNDVVNSNLHMKCNLYMHCILDKWQTEIQQKQSSEESGTKQRQELLHDTKMSLFPLLVKLRKALLPKNQLVSVATILFHLQRQEWDLCLQSYMQLSLGNVAWPIGVTSVGIHARSAHSKIMGTRNTRNIEAENQGNIATIMLDDSTRKWVTSLKRLITVDKALSNSSSSS